MYEKWREKISSRHTRPRQVQTSLHSAFSVAGYVMLCVCEMVIYSVSFSISNEPRKGYFNWVFSTVKPVLNGQSKLKPKQMVAL